MGFRSEAERLKQQRTARSFRETNVGFVTGRGGTRFKLPTSREDPTRIPVPASLEGGTLPERRAIKLAQSQLTEKEIRKRRKSKKKKGKTKKKKAPPPRVRQRNIFDLGGFLQ